MYFRTNLQFLRRQHENMTQERLAERMNVSRQTISKWESGEAYPEIPKLVELCDVFSCTLDALLRDDMTAQSSIYHPVRIEHIAPFHCASHLVISKNPREDAHSRLHAWASQSGVQAPTYIGWDFPYVSQEQKHRFGLRGYVAACVLPDDFAGDFAGLDHTRQEGADYAVMTIRDPFAPPLDRISRAYGLILEYLRCNDIKKKYSPGILPCFERIYEADGVTYMDVYIHCQGSRKIHIVTNFP